MVARGSAEEKALFDKRTSAERIFSYLKGKGGMARRPYRRRHVFHIMALGHALALHAKAWVRKLLGPKKPTDLLALTAALERLLATA